MANSLLRRIVLCQEFGELLGACLYRLAVMVVYLFAQVGIAGGADIYEQIGNGGWCIALCLVRIEICALQPAMRQESTQTVFICRQQGNGACLWFVMCFALKIC